MISNQREDKGKRDEKRRVPSKGPPTRISAVLVHHIRARNPEIALGPLVVGVCFGWFVVREVRPECLLEPLFVIF